MSFLIDNWDAIYALVGVVIGGVLGILRKPR